jgi:hypothetical protein
MSTLKVSTIQDTSGNNSSTPAGIASGTAKAWVNFNGTGTVAIRSSFNVSSITDSGQGEYTINYATAFADTNYAVVGTSDGVYNGGILSIGYGDSDNSGIQTANTRIEVRGGHGSGNPNDPTIVCVVSIST